MNKHKYKIIAIKTEDGWKNIIQRKGVLIWRSLDINGKVSKRPQYYSSLPKACKYLQKIRAAE